MAMQTILTWVAGAALALAAILSGALVSGDRVRANYQTEKPADRLWRVRVMLICLGVGVAAVGLAWAIS